MRVGSMALTGRFTTAGSGGGERRCAIGSSNSREQGVLAQMMVDQTAGHSEEKTVMIGVTYLRVYRTATSMAVKKGGEGA